MNDEQIQKCHAIAEHYGYESQSRILQEECAELIQAVSKMHRKSQSSAIVDYIEELADVSIMLEQMIHLLDGASKSLYNRWINTKLTRQEKRIEREPKPEFKVNDEVEQAFRQGLEQGKLQARGYIDE
jgi:NTP pyrophosphatase (non-canonical NTP hydrolase)